MELLSDPLNDRVVKSLPRPPHRPISQDLLFHENGLPNWRTLQSHLHAEGSVEKFHLSSIVRRAAEIFRQEPNLLSMEDPVTVVGDVHGQFYDLEKLLELGGSPESNKYLFLGDYVDRGSFSIEVVLLLLSLKINYPTTIYMMRGNHEARQMTTFFNFRQECIYKYDIEVYEMIMECFDCLPLACVLNERFLAVHGGISPELKTLDDFSRIDRFMEPPRQGVFCDLLWSDPVDTPDGKETDIFRHNPVRGCSYYYGAEAVNRFLKRNDLISVIRAHEAQIDGYKMHKWNGPRDFPSVVTLFSAPNYCDVYNNKGAIIKFDNNTLNIQEYTYTTHPYLLPDFMNIFTWSVPFVIEKVMQILLQILKPRSGEKIEAPGRLVEELKEEMKNWKKMFGEEVKSVSEMVNMFQTMREENEIAMKLGGMCPDNRLPKAPFIEGRSALEGATEDFQQAKIVDEANEKRPE